MTAGGPHFNATQNHQGFPSPSVTPTQVQLSNAIPPAALTPTNLPGQVASADDTSIMSASNRHAAKIMRHVLFSSYFFVLLLLLVYAAYRYWRWKQELERKRRERLARAEYQSWP
jgi:hypothetical protein